MNESLIWYLYEFMHVRCNARVVTFFMGTRMKGKDDDKRVTVSISYLGIQIILIHIYVNLI